MRNGKSNLPLLSCRKADFIKKRQVETCRFLAAEQGLSSHERRLHRSLLPNPSALRLPRLEFVSSPYNMKTKEPPRG